MRPSLLIIKLVGMLLCTFITAYRRLVARTSHRDYSPLYDMENLCEGRYLCD